MSGPVAEPFSCPIKSKSRPRGRDYPCFELKTALKTFKYRLCKDRIRGAFPALTVSIPDPEEVEKRKELEKELWLSLNTDRKIKFDGTLFVGSQNNSYAEAQHYYLSRQFLFIDLKAEMVVLNKKIKELKDLGKTDSKSRYTTKIVYYREPDNNDGLRDGFNIIIKGKCFINQILIPLQDRRRETWGLMREIVLQMQKKWFSFSQLERDGFTPPPYYRLQPYTFNAPNITYEPKRKTLVPKFWLRRRCANLGYLRQRLIRDRAIMDNLNNSNDLSQCFNNSPENSDEEEEIEIYQVEDNYTHVPPPADQLDKSRVPQYLNDIRPPGDEIGKELAVTEPSVSSKGVTSSQQLISEDDGQAFSQDSYQLVIDETIVPDLEEDQDN